MKKMPSYKEVESLKQMCFMIIAKDFHKIAVDLEENDTPKYMKKSVLNTIASRLPSVFIEQMICKVIETIHDTVQRSRRSIGLKTCLDVLLQPHILRLDLSGFFFKMRLPATINNTIRSVVCSRVSKMGDLTSFNMVSKCDDEILKALSEHCPNLAKVIISISDLVTDAGIKYISKGCPKLERLEIYKCWAVSSVGIENALKYAHNLKELHCDDLGNVFISCFKNTERIFKLVHFEQTNTTFEPSLEEANWIGRVCPDITSVRLYIDDEFLQCLPKMGKLKTIELELTSSVGEAFCSAIHHLALTLTSVHLSCECMDQSYLVLLGTECKNLNILHLTTATVENDQFLVNTGDYFQNLTSLHLQIWKETLISVSFVEFFLLWCRKLVSLVLKAEMEFFTDSFLLRILQVNPLVSAHKLAITSDKFVPLTIRSAHYLLAGCPNLEVLSVSSWDVSEEEYFDLTKLVKKNNYNFCIT